jgi:hypothetical protein
MGSCILGVFLGILAGLEALEALGVVGWVLCVVVWVPCGLVWVLSEFVKVPCNSGDEIWVLGVP